MSLNIFKPVIKKIPGEIPPLPKKSSQGFIDDLSNKQKFELLDLLERQNKLLANKRFIAKLPDKGEKILNFKEKIERELQHRNKIEDAANLLSRLNIAAEGKAAMSELEWTGNYKEKSKDEIVVQLDSDDETDPLKILAQPTGSGIHNKKIIHIVPNDTLIKPEDIREAKSFKTQDPLELEHVKYIVSKVENPENEKKREPFKPYKTTRSNVHDPEKEKQRECKKYKYWEVTAATPPLIIHGAVKTLDLNESLRLQKEHEAKLKEIQAKHAAERLAQQLGLHSTGGLPSNLGNHRGQNTNISDSSSEDEENYEEVYDDEDNDKAGTVVFTVDTEES
ncbi:uncharacterized protein LOC131665799 [Phymastichus coffea]|uniref:uncharacterized protein LOC131665799 n=1 Tax=Phymastichus coffea TaxID=108790 RepID=UPI00273BAF00|nr:uncharacterized protein LOC131665799 [Phymastichus coffea]